MEIERKYLIDSDQIPFDPKDYPCRQIEQGYLCTEPVVRIRRDQEEYFLTYKSKGLMIREEYNLPLTKDAYLHLRQKIDGRIISKDRYVIPLAPDSSLRIELDFFHGDLEGLILAEVEFPDLYSAETFSAPGWFGEDVTHSSRFHNSSLASMYKEEDDR